MPLPDADDGPVQRQLVVACAGFEPLERQPAVRLQTEVVVPQPLGDPAHQLELVEDVGHAVGREAPLTGRLTEINPLTPAAVPTYRGRREGAT